MDVVVKRLFTTLQPQIRGFGGDVVELCTGASVTYRVYDFFVEVIPRRHRLTLLINLAFEDCNDPLGERARPLVQRWTSGGLPINGGFIKVSVRCANQS